MVNFKAMSLCRFRIYGFCVFLTSVSSERVHNSLPSNVKPLFKHFGSIYSVLPFSCTIFSCTIAMVQLNIAMVQLQFAQPEPVGVVMFAPSDRPKLVQLPGQ